MHRPAKHRDAAADEATIVATSSDLNVCCTQALPPHPLHSRRLRPGANGQVHRNKHLGSSYEIARNGAIPFAMTDFVRTLPGAQTSLEKEGGARA